LMKRSIVETGYIGTSPVRHLSKLGVGAPVEWVRNGIADMLRSPLASIAFGVGLTLALYFGSALLHAKVFFGFAYMAFVVVALAFFAGGILALSRHNGAGGASALTALFRLWQVKFHLTLLALAVTALLGGWQWLSLLIARVASAAPIAADESLWSAVQGVDSPTAQVVLVSLALLFAILLFFLVSLSVPMVVDGDEEFLNALIVSYLASVKSPGASCVWLIGSAALTAMGVLLWFPLLALILPVIVHSAWHGYRAMVA